MSHFASNRREFLARAPVIGLTLAGAAARAERTQPRNSGGPYIDIHRNLWGDLSASSGAGALSRDRAFGQRFLARRADRILFGSDYLKPAQPVPQFELLASFDLPADVRTGIERGNAAKLLGLKL